AARAAPSAHAPSPRLFRSGRGVDICSPTNMRSRQWIELGLLQPFDSGRIPNLANVNPAMLKVGDEEWNFEGKGSHWLPHIWGTEIGRASCREREEGSVGRG